MTLWERLDFLIFPPRCLCCGKILEYVPSDETKFKDGYNFECACEKCSKTISRKRLVSKIDEGVNCSSVFEYDKEPKRVILFLKYHGYRDTALQLARIMYHGIKDNENIKRCDCITFVPASFSKKRKRGFNHAELLAKYIGKLTGLPCKDVIAADKKMKAQHTLNVYEREANVKNAYKAKKSLNNKRIMLIDDIVTTGATLKDCARALRQAGAESVCCVTVCKTIKR